MKKDYLKRHYGQTVKVNTDVADPNQDELTRRREKQGKWVVENGGRMPRIEVAGDICLRRPSHPPSAVEPMTTCFDTIASSSGSL
jgi:hypothetical protein